MKNSFLPIALNLSRKKILFIGAGKVAFRKFTKVLEYTNQITILSKEFNKNFDEYDFNKIEKTYSSKYLNDFDLVFICTNDIKLNKEITLMCQEKGILYNNSTTKEDMDFKMLATIKYDDFEITISNNNVKETMIFKEKLEKMLNNKWK